MGAPRWSGVRFSTLAVAILLLGTVATRLAGQLASPAASRPDSVPLTQRMWIGSKIYASIQAYFGHWEAVPDLDLDQVFRAYQQAAAAAGTRFQFDLATLAFMAQLGNGHSSFTDRWLFDVGGRPVGFTAWRVDGAWVVRTSRLSSLQPGDRIRTIDGMSVDSFVQQRLQYVAASSERAGIRRLWSRTYLFPATFDVELTDGRRMVIDRPSQQLAPAARPTYEERVHPDGTAYIRIPSFGEPAMEERAVAFLRRNVAAPAIVIDVRSNGGGTTPSQLIEALMDRPYRGFTASTTVTHGLFAAYVKIARDVPADALNDYTRGYLDAFDGLGRAQLRMPSTLVRPRDPIYTGPVFVLTDDACASACEDFVMPLRVSDRATVIGMRTSGSTGQPYVHAFRNMMSFRVSTKRVYFPDGAEFEGVGIQPHVEIVPSADDLRTERDPVLERAMAMAREATR